MRVGIIGWCAPTGLGQMHQTLYDYFLGHCKWLVPLHPKTGDDFYKHVQRADFVRCRREATEAEIESFFHGLDVVIIVERSFLTAVDVWKICRERKIFTVCVPMLEFLPSPTEEAWVTEPDMMWAVNIPTYIKLHEYKEAAACRWKKRIYFAEWGINLAEFEFKPRKTCDRFLFINGWGGTGDRKGIDIVAEAMSHCPILPLTVCSQTKEKLPKFPSGVDIRIGNPDQPRDLYALGDMLLAPSRWEGLGLQLREAYASGLPVITSDAAPMRDLVGAYTVEGCFGSKAINTHRTITSFEMSPKLLATAMRTWHKRDIGLYSQYVRHASQAFNHRQVLGQFRETLELHLAVRDFW